MGGPAFVAEQTPEEIHRLVRAAAIEHRPIAALYDGVEWLLCPHVVGYNQPGEWRVFCYQYGGQTNSGPRPESGEGIWRCLSLKKLSFAKLLDGPWQQGAGLGLLQIPPMDLGQVEVIKGTTSALYGAGAMAGVVNLISRRPQPEPVREFPVNQTALGGTDFSMFLASRLSSSWSGSFLGGGHWQQQRDRDDDGWADLSGYSRGLIRPRFYWDGGNGHSALLTGGITYYDFGGNAQFLLRGRYLIASRFSVSAQQHDHRFDEVRERDRHELMFGEVSLRGSTGRHTWVTGLAAERDAYRPRDVKRFAYTYVTPGFFLQDDINVASWLSVSASARVDFHNQYGTFLSSRISGLLRWAGWTSRLSAGQGFFAPTPLTEETKAAGLTRLSVPFPLKAERGRSASIDVMRGFGPVSFTATFFASTVRHPVHVDRRDRYEILNLREPTTNRGLEVLGIWRKEPFAVTTSYTHVRSSESELTGGRSDGLAPRFDTNG